MKTCSVCNESIEGEVERLTAITNHDGKEAHFFCFYPNGVEEEALELPSWALKKLRQIDPDRARFFRSSES